MNPKATAINYDTGEVNTIDDHDQYENVWVYYADFSNELGIKNFKFKGGVYRYDQSKSKIITISHPDAAHYIRIVGDFYKFITNEKGDKTLRPWDSKALTIDYSEIKEFKKMIKSYDGFCVHPSNTDFQKVINNHYNMYEPIKHIPKQGDFPHIKNYLQHIFGESIEMAMDYFTILWRYPTQKLPIIALVSAETGTGKSTLLFLTKAIFGENCSLLGNSEISSEFNSTYATKLLIGIDESFIEKKIVLEKIKSLNTSPFIWLNEKGVKQKQVQCHAHFLLTSNNETNFAAIDEHDSRFWIIKVNQPQDKVHNLMYEMEKEIPAFLHELNTREITIPCEDRFWFAPWRFNTEAKQKVIEASLPRNAKTIKNFLNEYIEKYKRKTIYFTKADLNEILKMEGGLGTFDAEFLQRYIPFEKPTRVSRNQRSAPFITAYTNPEQTSEEVQRFYAFHAKDYIDQNLYDELFPTPKPEIPNKTCPECKQDSPETEWEEETCPKCKAIIIPF